MKVLIYVNKAKDLSGEKLQCIIRVLNDESISYEVVDDSNLNDNKSATALFVLGGDGTILNVSQFAMRNEIPIIGINAGKLGFLTEFEQNDVKVAVNLLKNGQLVKDSRAVLECNYDGKVFTALNDVVLQRVEVEERGNNVTGLDVEIDGIGVEKIIGDGVVLSTATGSTAYSLSAGGAILSPGTEVFTICPIAAHSFNQRAIVYSSSSICKVVLVSDCATGIFVDGIFATKMLKGKELIAKRCEKSIVFLRKKGFNFYERLSKKLKDRTAVK